MTPSSGALERTGWGFTWPWDRTRLRELEARREADLQAEFERLDNTGERPATVSVAAESLVELLIGRGDDEALVELKARSESGDLHAAAGLTTLLARRAEDALMDLRDSAERGDSHAEEMLNRLLVEPEDQEQSSVDRIDEVDASVRVQVLASFSLTHNGTAVPLGVDSRRLVAYLAVHPRPQQRAAMAAQLWPGVADGAAQRLLADAVESVGVPGLLSGTDDADAPLSLAAEVEVDLAGAMGLIRALPVTAADAVTDISALNSDILPGWTAAWIAVERERFRQLRLHALEEGSYRLTAVGRFTEAIEMAQIAVKAAPSRESARRAVIEAYLAQGNLAAAIAEHDEFQELLRTSLNGPTPSGLEGLFPPSPEWPVLRPRRATSRSAVQLPGLRSIRGASGGTTRRLVAGGSLAGSVDGPDTSAPPGPSEQVSEREDHTTHAEGHSAGTSRSGR